MRTELSLRIAESIKRARMRAGFRANEAAERMGMSREAISRYEAGVRLPSIPALILMADAFDVSVDELLGRGAPRGLTAEEEAKRRERGSRSPSS